MNIASFLRSEKNFHLILNNLDEGIHIVDQDGNTIVYNKKVAEIDGLEPEEVMGKNIFEIYPSLTLETSTLMQTLKTGEAIDNIQQTFINTRGKKITTVNTTVPIEFANGEQGAMEISRDITELENLITLISDLRNNFAGEETGKKKNKKVKDNNTSYSFQDIIGQSPNFKEVIRDAMRAAGSDSSIILCGETGTGKELFAQSIHNASNRSDRPFIAQNCAALPKDLLEGLLFGTEKGGFTGARSRPGLFEQADGGTILLDEINSMALALQAKLLRVLQENKVRRVGGQEEKPIDVRVITTMNISPEKAFQENRLREDLYYRLNVVYLKIPPLRERTADIPLLIDHFVDLYNSKFSQSVRGVSENLLSAMQSYKWPGNVRELQHIIESAFNMLRNEDVIKLEVLPGYFRERLKNEESMINNINNIIKADDIPPLNNVLEQIEKKLIKKALTKTGDNISAAAREMNISRQSLQYKIKKYGIST